MSSKVVTQLEAAPAYYRVEAHHQEDFPNDPNHGDCAAVVAPKVAKFRKTWKAFGKA